MNKSIVEEKIRMKKYKEMDSFSRLLFGLKNPISEYGLSKEEMEEYWEDISRVDIMKMFFYHFKDRFETEVSEEHRKSIEKMVKKIKFDKNERDSDAYPLSLERKVYFETEQYFIDVLGWDEEWMR